MKNSKSPQTALPSCSSVIFALEQAGRRISLLADLASGNDSLVLSSSATAGFVETLGDIQDYLNVATDELAKWADSVKATGKPLVASTPQGRAEAV